MTSITIGADQPRLLIADDDSVVLSMLGTSLGPHFEVVGVASDGEQAIELARVSQPDVALVDVEMPKGGGLGARAAETPAYTTARWRSSCPMPTHAGITAALR